MVNAPFVTRLVCAMGRSGTGGRRMQSPNRPSLVKTWEKWMKLVKTSAIAFAMSAMLAGPVLAQGVSSDTQIRGGAQGRSNMQGGASGSGDEEFNAQPGAPGAKAGANAKAGVKGTVGAGSGAPKGTAGAVGDPAAGGKRY
jgi:hypothetical protein